MVRWMVKTYFNNFQATNFTVTIFRTAEAIWLSGKLDGPGFSFHSSRKVKLGCISPGSWLTLKASLSLCSCRCRVRLSIMLNRPRDKSKTPSVATTKADGWRTWIRSAQFRDGRNKSAHSFFFDLHCTWSLFCLVCLFTSELLPLFLWLMGFLKELKRSGEFMLVHQMLLPSFVAF